MTNAAIQFSYSDSSYICAIVQRSDASPEELINTLRQALNNVENIERSQSDRLDWDYVVPHIISCFSLAMPGYANHIKMWNRPLIFPENSCIFTVNVYPDSSRYESDKKLYKFEDCVRIKIMSNTNRIEYDDFVSNFNKKYK